MASSPSVLVVGAGISGLACTRALEAGGVTVRVVDRGRKPGGRMSGRTLHGRAVDLGASYFTAKPGTDFDAVVQGWVRDGVAREWTDTFATAGPDGIRDRSSGPMRYGAPTGLRDVVIALADGLDVEQEHAIEHVTAGRVVDGARYDAVVLAMPDPQARRVLADDVDARARLQEPGEWEASIAVALGFERREWPDDLHGAFVSDSAAVTFLADDGDRRGDDAPVLVAHTGPDLAREHLDDPDGVVAPVVEAVTGVLGTGTPDWTHAHRWTFSKPTTSREEPFLLVDGIGVCGDGWGGKSSVGTAWASGDALGRALAGDLA